MAVNYLLNDQLRDQYNHAWPQGEVSEFTPHFEILEKQDSFDG